MTEINTYNELRKYFAEPEKTKARIAFGNPPNLATFEEAKVVVFGVCFDDTATFGKGSERGPEVMRHVSARQIETYVIDEKVDVYWKVAVFDLGDLKLKGLSEKERKILLSEDVSENVRKKVLIKLGEVIKQFEIITDVVKFLRSQNKIPLMLGGEHTLSYFALRGVAKEKPVVLHFDAHRDAKASCMGMKFCHTTPMFHFVSEFEPGNDFVQIGIRQASEDEQQFAGDKRIVTIYPNDIRKNFDKVKEHIRNKTKGRKVYITFDIDALDIAYTPCTGTPEPFGLKPEQVVELFKAVDSSAQLIGIDMMEVAVRGEDYREATTAVQLLLRLLAREYIK